MTESRYLRWPICEMNLSSFITSEFRMLEVITGEIHMLAVITGEFRTLEFLTGEIRKLVAHVLSKHKAHAEGQAGSVS